MIEEILAYHDSPDYVNIHLEDAAKHMRRGFIGLVFGNFGDVLDVANLIVASWNEIN